MSKFQVGDRVSLEADDHKPPKVFDVKTAPANPGEKYVITDKDGNDQERAESELRRAPPPK